MEVKGWKAIKGESLRQKFRGAHGEMVKCVKERWDR